MKYWQASASFNEPVTIAELRKHLRIEHNEEDSYLSMLIGAARASAENYIDGVIADRAFVASLDDFEPEVTLPIRPVSVETVNVSYIDEQGDSQALVAYDHSQSLYRTTLRPAYDADWPEVEQGFDKVTINFTAGFSAFFGEMPKDVKHAILMIAGTLYDQREDHTAQVKLYDVPMSSRMLLDPYRKVTL